jgi:ribosomal protein S18 acetylase RimI-like enzyme
VVPLLHDGARALVDRVFTAGAAAFLRRDFVRGHGLFGYANTLVAAGPDGEIVGALTAYEGSRHRRLSRWTRLCVLLHFGPVRSAAVARRMAAVERLCIPPRPDSLFLANLCVAPAHRSRGYGSVLLHEALTVARERGATRVELDVASSNLRAQRLYERLDWTVVTERWACCGHGGDGLRRMERSVTWSPDEPAPGLPGRGHARHRGSPRVRGGRPAVCRFEQP